MSAFPPEADLAVRVQIVRKVPEADISLQPAGNLWPMKRVVSDTATKPRNKMAAPDRFIAWCKQEQASIEQQLELLQSGKVRTGEDIGAGWIDTTEQSIERARARLSELNDLLTEAGTATVVKPSAL